MGQSRVYRTWWRGQGVVRNGVQTRLYYKIELINSSSEGISNFYDSSNYHSSM